MIGHDFYWDPEKVATNRRRHGVSFEEATEIFGDPFELTIHDPLHSEDEDRWISFGASYRNRILAVVYKEDGDTIRIISARRASKRERDDYEENQRRHAS
jgi:hypothetical protein